MSCSCCGKPGMAVRKTTCADPKCTKLTIFACLGCQANAINRSMTRPTCLTCQKRGRPKKKRGAGISAHESRH